MFSRRELMQRLSGLGALLLLPFQGCPKTSAPPDVVHDPYKRPQLRGLTVLRYEFSRWLKCEACGLHRPMEDWFKDNDLQLRPGEGKYAVPYFEARCPSFSFKGRCTGVEQTDERPVFTTLQIVDYPIHRTHTIELSPFEIEVLQSNFEDEKYYYYTPSAEFTAAVLTKRNLALWKRIDKQLLICMRAGYSMRINSELILDVGHCGKPRSELDQLAYNYSFWRPPV